MPGPAHSAIVDDHAIREVKTCFASTLGMRADAGFAIMFWGEGGFRLPLMLVYTAISYSVFRGKAGSSKRY